MTTDGQPQRGVLWKRRDVFKNSWRPRWFDLQPDQGLLTYYLLSGGSTSLPVSVDDGNDSNHPQFLRSLSSNPLTPHLPPLPRDMLRARATSWDSATSPASENSVDYDVVPRGTIYLWGGGCTVSINDSLSKPSENLFAFTIRPSEKHATSNNSDSTIPVTPDNVTAVHLAARTPELRDIWVRKIHQVCISGQQMQNIHGSSIPPMNNPLMTPIPSHTSNLRRRSNSRSRLQEQFVQRHEPILEETNADVYSHGSLNVEESFMEESDPQQDPRQEQPANGVYFSTTDVLFPDSTQLSWESEFTSQEAALFRNVPEPLVLEIRKKLSKYLAIISAGQDNEEITTIGNSKYKWKILPVKNNRNDNNLRFVTRQCLCSGESIEDVSCRNVNKGNGSNNKKFALIKSEATMSNPAKQIFNLIANVSRRKDYEPSIRHAERLKVYNSHTFLDYYSSNSVWPTKARDFAVVTHWQVLTRSDGERGIAMISFSCAEAESLRPVAPDRVRGTLLVSMYLIRDVGDDTSHVTRLLSFDLAGNVNQQIANMVITQQGNFLGLISDHLRTTEPTPFEGRLRSSELLSNQDVIRNVVQNLLQNSEDIYTNESTQSSNFSNDSRARNDSIENTNCLISDLVTEKNAAESVPSVISQAFILLAPVFFHHILVILKRREIAVPVFCVAVFVAIRQIVLLHLGTIVKPTSCEPVFNGSFRFRFSVDLKGVLRFIANKKEARADSDTSSADVSVVHIVACAVARALKKQKELSYRRVTIPWLLIDEVVDSSFEPVHVSVLNLKSSPDKRPEIVTVKFADRLDVQSVANEIASKDSELSDNNMKNFELGHCLVVANSTREDDEMSMEQEIELLPFTNSGIAVLATLGQVRLQRRRTNNAKQISASGTSSQPPRPVLAISLTVIPNGNLRLTDTYLCRRYADEVRKLLQFPEMCDG